MSLNLGSLFLSTALVATLALPACSPKDTVPRPESTMTGGQDGGGGEISSSSLEEVKSTLKQALEWAGNPDFETNVFARFYFDQILYVDVDYLDPKFIFPQMIPLQDLASQGGRKKAFQARFFESPALQALKKNKITTLDQGDCPSPEKKHADASVSALNTEAEICFSAGNLRRVPPTALLKTLLGLVLHEALHMGGAPEEIAQAWQNKFHGYFDARYAGIGTDHSFLKIGHALHSLIATSSTVEQLYKDDPEDPRIYTYLGILLRQLASTPYLLDSPMLDYSKGAARPEFKNNFVNAVIALTERIWNALGVSQGVNEDEASPRRPFKKLSRNQMKTFLKKIEEDLEIINHNWIAYTWPNEPGEDLRSYCRLPVGPLPEIFYAEELKTVSSFGAPPKAPPKVCDLGSHFL